MRTHTHGYGESLPAEDSAAAVLRGSARPFVRALLTDGTVVRLRELDAADAAIIGRLHRALPETDRYLRFFTAAPIPADDVLARYVVTMQHGAAVGAFVGDELIGVASYATGSDKRDSEVAFAVGHPEQAHGVGTLLLEHLASLGRSRGVHRFVAEVLPVNVRMRRMFLDVGLPVEIRMQDGTLHVELELYPDERYLTALAAREESADVASLAAVLAPRSVAVIGASRRPDAVGSAVLRNIVAAGYTGDLVAVNPHETRIDGIACYPRIADLPEAVDLAVVCVPAAAVPAVTQDCGRRGVRALLVITSGLSADPAVAAQLLDMVGHYDMRLVGPNCLGLANTDPEIRLDAGFGGASPRGEVGLVTQSGGVAIAVQAELTRLGLGVSTMVSTGDKYDVSGNDMLLWWHHDESTRLAVLHLESFGNPRKFARFARRLAERIPVLTLRSGSSDAGQRAAASYTAGPTTPQVTTDALFRQAGVIAVDRLSELTELVAALSWQPLPAGRRVALISNAGGLGVLAADACAASGLSVPTLSVRTQQALREVLPAGATTANPVDTTAIVPPAVFAAGVAALLADPAVDAVVALTVQTSLGDPFAAIAQVAGNTAAQADGRDIPLLAVRLGQAEHVACLQHNDCGPRVPCFAEPAAAVTALAHAADRAEWLSRAGRTQSELGDVDAPGAVRLVAACRAASPAGGWLDPEQVRQLLGRFGLPVGPPEEPPMGRPAAPGRELRLGVTSDGVFGPLVSLGLGGAATDLVGDRAYRLVPVSAGDAGEMLDQFDAERRLLTADADHEAVRDSVLRVARLADLLPEVVELDINPLVVNSAGCMAVDARIRLMPLAPGDPTLRQLKI